MDLSNARARFLYSLSEQPKPTIEQGDLGFNEDLTRGEKNIRTVKASKRLVKAADALFLPSHKQFAKDQHFIEVQRFRTLDDKPYLIERSIIYLKS